MTAARTSARCASRAPRAARPRRSARPALGLAVALACAACGAGEPSSNPIAPLGGGGEAGAGPGGAGAGGGPECFQNPKTHDEIINACTNATKVKKAPNLRGLNADGSLPPLP